MKKLVWSALFAAATVAAAPAFAQASGTVDVTGTVAARCSAVTPISGSIALGELRSRGRHKSIRLSPVTPVVSAAISRSCAMAPTRSCRSMPARWSTPRRPTRRAATPTPCTILPRWLRWAPRVAARASPISRSAAVQPLPRSVTVWRPLRTTFRSPSAAVSPPIDRRARCRHLCRQRRDHHRADGLSGGGPARLWGALPVTQLAWTRRCSWISPPNCACARSCPMDRIMATWLSSPTNMND